MQKNLLLVGVTSLLLLSGCNWFSGCSDCKSHDHESHGSKQASSENSAITKVTSASEFEEHVLKSKKPVLVDFGAKWCGACQTMKPTIEELSQELGNRYTFVEVDVDKAGDIAGQFNIRGIPTFTFFKDGKEVPAENERIIGAVDKETLKKALTKYLG